MPSEGKVMHSSEAKSVSLRGTRIAYLITGEDSQNCSLLEFSVEPGCGSGVHHHSNFEEIFYVLEGEMRFQKGDQSVSAGAGTVVFVPQGCPHGFTNEGAQVARMLMMTLPAGYEQYFAKVAEIVAKEGPLDVAGIGELRREYDTVQVSPPLVK